MVIFQFFFCISCLLAFEFYFYGLILKYTELWFFLQKYLSWGCAPYII